MNDNPTRKSLREDEDDTSLKNILSRTRKATMASAVAFAGSMSAFAIGLTKTGTLSWEEVSAALIISVGVAAATWFATWAVPNAQ